MKKSELKQIIKEELNKILLKEDIASNYNKAEEICHDFMVMSKWFKDQDYMRKFLIHALGHKDEQILKEIIKYQDKANDVFRRLFLKYEKDVKDNTKYGE